MTNKKALYGMSLVVLVALAAVLGYRFGAEKKVPETEAAVIPGQNTTVRQQAQVADSESPAGADPQVAQDKNHLGESSSPYLLLHKDNPVHWYPWGEAAFEKARKQNKPIFLSIGYSTCYWCHVMERESFSDPIVARLLNEHFVSIKVDREEHTAVDEIYMTALQLMQQRGGWPLSMFLTPDLQPFTGGTYFPRDHFMEMLTRINGAWESEPEKIKEFAAKLTTVLNQAEKVQVADRVPGNRPVDQVAQWLRDNFDLLYGGFGQAPKFPQPSKLEFLLTRYELNGDTKDLDMVIRTLDAMAQGGIYDQAGSGFHRYSTDGQWAVPHFEKMLYDNALLLHTYTRAHSLTGHEQHKRTALEIAEFIDRVMTGEHGMFYSALDSETDHEEGAYYVWTREQVREVLTEQEYALAETVYGLKDDPFFEGRYVLLWPQDYEVTAKELGMTETELFERLVPVRDKLLKARRQRERPLLDDKVITGWNGMMIEALAYAGVHLGQPELVERAARAADAVLSTLRPQGILMHVYRDDRIKLEAYLDDYATLISGLIELYQATAESRRLEQARALADEMIATLWDEAGGFYYIHDAADDLLIRTRGGFDGAIPSGNSLVSMALMRLIDAGEQQYLPWLAGVMKAYAAHLQRNPVALVGMVEVLARYHATAWPVDIALPKAEPVNIAAAGPDPGDVVPSPARPDLGSAGYVSMHAGLYRYEDAPAELIVSFDIANDWHINANPASLEFLVPTTIQVERNGSPVELEIEYPAGKMLEAGLQEPIAVYSGRVDIAAHPGPDPEKANNLEVKAVVQACNDSGRCLLPADLSAPVNPE